MNFTDEQIAFRDMAAEFAEHHLAPYSSSWDNDSFFPVDTFKKAAALGFAGIVASEDIGGSNLTRLDSAIIFEQLSRACISTSAYLSIHNMVTTAVDKHAHPEIRIDYGKKLSTMEWFASYCLTEPGAGSDAASLKTTAKKQGDHYILNGIKAFISGATISSLYLVMARTEEGISAFLVEGTCPGIRFGSLEKKMGWKSQPTTMVYFDECIIPKTHLLGKEGEGFKIALNALNGGRINIAACSLGGALACLSRTRTYMKERRQFNTYLADMPVLRTYFSEMATSYEAARHMVYQAATFLDQKHSLAPMYCAMAKRIATDNAFAIADKAMQIHGGYGYLHDYKIEQIFRDLRVHQILEGTNEIMSDIIARSLFNDEHYSLMNWW